MYAIGLDVGGTNLRLAVVDQQGEIIFHKKESTPGGSASALLEKINEMYESTLQTIPEAKLLGMGIGWPGTIDKNLGLTIETPNLAAFQNFPLLPELKKKIKLPLVLENDAKCAGIAEKYFGASQDLKDFVLLTFGTGIGGVIFSQAHLVRGRSGLAGEIGHMCLYPGGLPCGCGSLGCFEKYCSAKALEDQCRQLGHSTTARELLGLSTPWAEKILDQFVRDLALAIGSLTNILDPEAFIFSGGLFTTGGGPILSRLENQLSQQGFKKGKMNLKLLASQLEGQAGVIGAASLILHSADLGLN